MRSDIAYGDGMYKSTDGGTSWTHIGLTDTKQIGAIVVDPHNANVVYVAALGHPYGPNAERGVFKTTDGGERGAKILYKDPDTGATALAMAPDDPNVIYAALWQTRRPPWNVYPPSNGPGSGLYQIDRRRARRGRSSPRVCRRTSDASVSRSRPPHRIESTPTSTAAPDLAVVYRSDDAGATWTPYRRRAAHLAARLVFQRHHGRSAQRRRRLRHEHLDVSIDERRKEFRCDLGRSERPRSSRALDRSERFESHDPRQRPGCRRQPQRREDVELMVQPADGAVLPRRQPTTRFRIPPTVRSRTPARTCRQRGASTERSRNKIFGRSTSAAKTAISRRIRVIPGSFTATRAVRRPTVRRRFRRPAGNKTSIRSSRIPERSGATPGRCRSRSRRSTARRSISLIRIFSGRATAARRGRSSARISRVLTRERLRISIRRRSPTPTTSRATASSMRSRRRRCAPSVVWAGTDDGYIWVTRSTGSGEALRGIT